LPGPRLTCGIVEGMGGMGGIGRRKEKDSEDEERIKKEQVQLEGVGVSSVA